VEEGEDAGEGMAKLKGVGGKGDGGRVDAGPGIVDDDPVAAVALGDKAGGRKAEAGEVSNRGIRYHQPMTSGNHVGELFAKESLVEGCARVRTTGNGSIQHREGARWSGGRGRGAKAAELLEEGGSRVGEGGGVGQTGGAALGAAEGCEGDTGRQGGGSKGGKRT
jgi:hypothetical protein